MPGTPADEALRESTGSLQADRVLHELAARCRRAFPGRLRSVYVVGSYGDGSAVAGSDLDVGVVFDEPLAGEALEQFRQIVRELAAASPLRLDCGTVHPGRFVNGVPAALKAARVVYGEDVFAPLPLEAIEGALRRAMSNAFHSLFVLRQRDDSLRAPLDVPDATGEYYGYERWGTYLGNRTFGPGVRSLVTSVTLMATCLVGMQSGTPVASKHESVRAYRAHVADAWAGFVEDVYVTCKTAWQYQMPHTPHDRLTLRRLCGQMPGFENQFLAGCRPWVLADLLDPDDGVRALALYRLKRIAYPGEDFVSALKDMAAHDPAAEAVLIKLRRGQAP